MPSILPAEKRRTTARERFLANLLLPRARKQVLPHLREIIERWRLSALLQPIMDLKAVGLLNLKGLTRGPASVIIKITENQPTVYFAAMRSALSAFSLPARRCASFRRSRAADRPASSTAISSSSASPNRTGAE